MSRTINITPTWSALLPVLLLAAREATTAEARRTAEEELKRMAKAADNWNEHCRLANATAVPAADATLTRQQAHDLITERHHGGDDPLVCLLDLQQHWIGHRDHEPIDGAAAIAEFLHEYVDERAAELDDRTPRHNDTTDLTAPEAT